VLILCLTVPCLGRASLTAYEVVRRFSIESLSHIKTPDTLPVLIRALKDRSLYVRDAAVFALATISDPAAVEPLIDALKAPVNSRDEDLADSIVSRIIALLGKFKDRRATAVIIEHLDHRDPWVREQAIHSLGELKDPLATLPLIRFLENDPDSCHRIAVANALGMIGDARAVGSLKKRLYDLG
jgi:HEAT repeat protein